MTPTTAEQALPTCLEWASTIREWVIVAIAGFGAWVAYQGLATWRRQLTGAAAHGAAAALLRAALVLQHAVAAVRDPMAFASIFGPRESERYQSMQTLYRTLVSQLDAAWAEFQAASIQVQAAIPAAAQEVQKHEERLYNRTVGTKLMVASFASIVPEALEGDPQRATSAATKTGLIPKPNGERDEFGEAMAAEIETLTTFLRPHLE